MPNACSTNIVSRSLCFLLMGPLSSNKTQDRNDSFPENDIGVKSVDNSYIEITVLLDILPSAL